VIGWCVGRLANPGVRHKDKNDTRSVSVTPTYRCQIYSIWVAPNYSGGLEAGDDRLAVQLLRAFEARVVKHVEQHKGCKLQVATCLPARSKRALLEIESLGAACGQGAGHVYRSLGYDNPPKKCFEKI
jgi:hypothetical protein